MGQHQVNNDQDSRRRRLFTTRLLDDLRALDQMIAHGQIESGVTRMGAEQELFLIDSYGRPAAMASRLLKELNDPRFTTELARFNLEFNLDPLTLTGDCLGQLHTQLDQGLAQARRVAQGLDIDVLMTGILPTLEKSDMHLGNMAPVPRYRALNDVFHALRGRDFRLHIRGRDELSLRHDNVMMEACNTSFQVHMQVSATDFAHRYNVAQAAAAPVLAAAVGSPLLFGRRLWHETRIALFQQSLDTRQASGHRRKQQARVSFGDSWLDDSVLEIFQEDVARFRLLLTSELEEDSPLDLLRKGELPKLKALCLHNGTVYRWNRPCYGVADGVAHLRIENRMLPSGPTVIDEVANAAFWLGLVKGLADEYFDLTRMLAFDSVRKNFQDAARHGLGAQIEWFGGTVHGARDLILQELLPRARAGLESWDVAAEDRDRYLGVIEERVAGGQTAARWQLDSLAALSRGEGGLDEQLMTLTAALRTQQLSGEPVHSWPIAQGRPSVGHDLGHHRVAGLMTTDLFTVDENDPLNLAADLMDWRHIRHVPVEDSQHRLVGLLTHRALIRALTQNLAAPGEPVPVHRVMARQLVTVSPHTPTLEALELMARNRIACLPVVEDGRLVGIVTERDIIRPAHRWLSLLTSQGVDAGEILTRPAIDTSTDDSSTATPAP